MTVPDGYSVPSETTQQKQTGLQAMQIEEIKCDESKPTCGGCKKYGLDCEFALAKQRKSPRPAIIIPLRCRSESTEHPRAISMNSPSDRLLELRLMHHFTVVCA
ncbi:hypothetical protein BKA65DRAFT_536838 [Rhexocercosporidium sp. MPI-PUGE-AT-0058]|nr:hypothetical protein BKA65DRAFT_536838 [Rhexocercosporidium sp. MPI-PUGE-AT-0058]